MAGIHQFRSQLAPHALQLKRTADESLVVPFSLQERGRHVFRWHVKLDETVCQRFRRSLSTRWKLATIVIVSLLPVLVLRYWRPPRPMHTDVMTEGSGETTQYRVTVKSLGLDSILAAAASPELLLLRCRSSARGARRDARRPNRVAQDNRAVDKYRTVTGLRRVAIDLTEQKLGCPPPHFFVGQQNA